MEKEKLSVIVGERKQEKRCNQMGKNVNVEQYIS